MKNKIFKLFLITLLIVLCVNIFAACTPDDPNNGDDGTQQQGEGGNEDENPTPPDNRSERQYIVTIRTTQFLIIEDARFFYKGAEIKSEFEGDAYTLNKTKEDFKDLSVVKSGSDYTFKVANINPIAPETSMTSEVLVIALTVGQSIDINSPFKFSGKAVDDFTGEVGIAGVKIMVGDNIAYVTDSLGNYDIWFLYEDTTFTFVKEGYTFNPTNKTVYEETSGFRVRGIV